MLKVTLKNIAESMAALEKLAADAHTPIIAKHVIKTALVAARPHNELYHEHRLGDLAHDKYAQIDEKTGKVVLGQRGNIIFKDYESEQAYGADLKVYGSKEIELACSKLTQADYGVMKVTDERGDEFEGVLSGDDWANLDWFIDSESFLKAARDRIARSEQKAESKTKAKGAGGNK